MAGKIKYTAITLVVLLGVVFLVLTFAVDSMVKSNIEQIGGEMTGTRVTVDDVSISVFSGQGIINGLRVYNPEGYQTEHALTVEDFSIKLDLWTLLSDMIMIEEVIISGPVVFVEQKLPENNLINILGRIKEAESKGTSAETDIFISYFLLKKGSAHFYTEIGGERSVRMDMDAIELRDLGGGDQGRTIEKVVREIASRIIEQAHRTVSREGVDQLRDLFEKLFR